MELQDNETSVFRVEFQLTRKGLIMILVRYVFQAKWGMADKAVEMFKKYAEPMRKMFGGKVRVRILTDLSGPFHTVVQEMQVENLAEWERLRAAMFASDEAQEMEGMEGDENPFESGYTELFTIEAEF